MKKILVLMLASVALCSVGGVDAFAEEGQKIIALSPTLSLKGEGGVFQGLIEKNLSTLSFQKNIRGAEAVSNFYAARGYEPFWVTDRGVSETARDFIEEVQNSWKHGLNSNTYHIENIKKYISFKNKDEQATLELLLTEAYIRLGQDLSGIRINPAALGTQKSYWKQPYTPEYLLNRLQKTSDVSDMLESFAPQGQTYKRVQAELESLLKAKAPETDSVLPLVFSGELHPYDTAHAVPDLRFRLGLKKKAGDEAFVYDEKLATAVITFQRDNGLKPDGIVGGQTLEILNLTKAHRITQLLANLERLRWVYDEKPEKFVMVNIPSATLWAVEGGRMAFDMPVIVGRSKRPTNMFVADITGVRFNPNWTVPPTIKKDDILPKLQKDPNYLQGKGMDLISGSGVDAARIDPLGVDWQNMTSSELGKLRMVQSPGSHNPLGRVRILMPNVYNVYLHDTNQPEYFNHAARAESSGCVRLYEPEKLAEFLMKDRPDWTPERMEALFTAGKTKDLSVPAPVPVYMLYYTVWIDAQGRFVYGNDLYGYDAVLVNILKGVDGVPVFKNNGLE